MELGDYLRVLRLRWRLIVATTLITLGLAAAITALAQPVYRSSAQLFISTGAASDLQTASASNFYIQQRLSSYAQLINSPEVIEEASRTLGGAQPGLAGRVSAEVPADTVLINVLGSGSTPQQAQSSTAAVADAFSNLIGRLEPANAGDQAVVVSIVRPAALPSVPVSPRTSTNLAIGLIVGLFVGVALALIRETLDNRLRSPEEITRLTGLPLLAVVSQDPTAKAHPLVTTGPKHSVRSEAYRRLRTNLQFVDLDERLSALVVTSSVPSEGKTTTACNLAVLLAEAGVEVVLVEGDLRRPRVADYLGIEGAVGLTDVLIGRVPLEDALQPWGDSGRLSVLASGQLPPNPSEVLGSQQLVALLTKLRQSAMVIIDAPPLLPVTDAAVLTAQADGALIVAKAGSTTRAQFTVAVRNITDIGGRVFGAVYNMAPAKGPDGYGYGYGYAYSYAPSPSKSGKASRMPSALQVDGRTFAAAGPISPESSIVYGEPADTSPVAESVSTSEAPLEPSSGAAKTSPLGS